MSFIELDRDSISLPTGKVYRPEELELYRITRSGQLKWPDLLERDRVIVLAEAASGKSVEFQERCAAIKANGRCALYLTIEQLDKNGLVATLGLIDRNAFLAWQVGIEPGWFFLDSIDEARINQKDVANALDRFAVELGAGYERAHVLLSCRGTVWESDKDLALVAKAPPILPRTNTEDTASIDPEEALLTKPEKKSSTAALAEVTTPQIELVLLAANRLATPDLFRSLGSEQRRAVRTGTLSTRPRRHGDPSG